MKLFFFLLLLPALAFGQKETRQEAPIKSVTVFKMGAQIRHTKKVDLQTGTQKLIFEKLTDFIDVNSVQLKSSGPATILSVRTRKNFDSKSISQTDMDTKNAKKKSLEKQEQKLRDEYKVLLLDEQLLLKNNDLGSQQQAVKISELKEASTFYHTRMTEIQNRKSELQFEIEVLVRAQNDLEQEIVTMRSLPVKNYTEIEVELDVDKAGSVEFEFSYITPNASWKPYYDMRSNGIGAPVVLEAKGLVTQNTGIDWNNVHLVLSTNDPYDGTDEPKLEPWYLDFYTPLQVRQSSQRPATAYDYSGETIHGEVLDGESGEPLAFARISLSNSPGQIITTDASGKFSFMVPRNEYGYTVSYLGYNSVYQPINAPYTKILLYPEAVAMDELQQPVTGTTVNTAGSYATIPGSTVQLNGKYERSKRQLEKKADAYEWSVEDKSYASLATVQQKDLRMEFDINVPFSVPSDNADHRVAITTYNLNANYEYHAVPKLDPSAYLVAQISGWEKLNLLSGESNLYFDGTFIGKSYIDVNSSQDTLNFSLGKDHKIVIDRKKYESMSKTKLIGNKRHYDVQWDYTVRNNGSASIPIVLKDNFPVSVNGDIKVKEGSHEGAELNEKTGILTWRFSLTTGQSKTFNFSYSVEYPNGQVVNLE